VTARARTQSEHASRRRTPSQRTGRTSRWWALCRAASGSTTV